MSKLPPGVYAICDPSVRPELPLTQQAALFIRGGATILQLRYKQPNLREFLEVSRKVAQRCREAGVLCLINDRVDLAILCGADGVHLGDDDLPARAARQLLGSRLVGVTVRNPEQALQAKRDGADYVGLGPVFLSPTKQLDFPILGVDRFRKMVREIDLPVVGIGGITAENIADLAEAGATAAACISALLVGDPAESTGNLVRAFHAGRERRTLVSR